MDVRVPDLGWIDALPRGANDLVAGQRLGQRGIQARVEETVVEEGTGVRQRRDQRGATTDQQRTAPDGRAAQEIRYGAITGAIGP